ncbi:hypothetical protein L6452_14040 [Arctium lappa]|uniref:Uncharacterized protein n=1 Tax=Arctium lappa TaxID=4217 RepID=A0ACB9CJY2_ARCLA|nr:hypothetical protein L6452_14040 [Arctium lappa]
METSGSSATTTKGEEKGIKVKHISSPVMVEAKDPSEFKQIVQRFTGQTPKQANFTTTTTTTVEPDSQAFSSSYKPSRSTNPQTEIYSWSWKEIADRHSH